MSSRNAHDDDTSAVLAWLKQEPERERIVAALEAHSLCRISAASLLEALIVVRAREHPTDRVYFSASDNSGLEELDRVFPRLCSIAKEVGLATVIAPAVADAGRRAGHLLGQEEPVGYVKKNATKRLAAITKLAFDVIPQDPTRPEYRQGATLGDEHKHWFRAKFFRQYRLFFRYHAPSKLIVFAWLNDEDTKRAYERSDDAYRMFRKMLESGHPPDDWTQLLAEARAESQRLQRFAPGIAP